jgi:hypothetical protein
MEIKVNNNKGFLMSNSFYGVSRIFNIIHIITIQDLGDYQLKAIYGIMPGFEKYPGRL